MPKKADNGVGTGQEACSFRKIPNPKANPNLLSPRNGVFTACISQDSLLE